MRLDYIGRRVVLLVVIVWAAASLNFLVPHLSPADPIQEMMLRMVSQGGVGQGEMEETVKYYKARFGLDKPLWMQYLRYLANTFRFDLGFSASHFPAKVSDIILRALPWTMVLLTIVTLIAFGVGSVLGALLAWPKSPRALRFLVPPLLTLSAVPYYLLGLVLIYFLAFSFRVFPLGGGYTLGTLPNLGLSFFLDAARHAVLPALSIVLAGVGFWALAMRGMMVTVQGEDYMTFGEARGLKGSRLFLRYAMRNAILPQTTSLALSLGHVVSGAVLVEVVFSYPGVGALLYQAIRGLDFFLIYGIVFMVVLGIAVATLVIDLVNPLIDPRITT
ncbi:MAG: ABC transporter permease [Chloroflexota bacterium]|nr:ABC transporter permease [Chloroflexota bacterium]